MQEEVKSAMDQNEQTAQLALIKKQLERTRAVNSALWARINHGAITRSDDGTIKVPTPEQKMATLEAENDDLRTRCRHLEQTLSEVQHTNGELWKRVDHAESSAAYIARRKLGAMLRKIGLR